MKDMTLPLIHLQIFNWNYLKHACLIRILLVLVIFLLYFSIFEP